MLVLADHEPVDVVIKRLNHSTEEEILADKRQHEAARRLWRLISSDVLVDFADWY